MDFSSGERSVFEEATACEKDSVDVDKLSIIGRSDSYPDPSPGGRDCSIGSMSGFKLSKSSSCCNFVFEVSDEA